MVTRKETTMPAVKSRKGAVPSTAIGEPYRPIRKRPKLAAPIPSYGDADVVTNNSMTAYDDKTGRELFHAGDRADGVPEAVSVRPLSNRPTESTAPVDEGASFAYGGTMVAGAASANPAQRRIDQAKRRQEQLRQMQAAETDNRNIESTAISRLIQAGSDSSYGQLGVSAPQTVDLNGQASSSPLVRGRINTNAETLGRQFGRENDLADAEDAVTAAGTVEADKIATSTTNAQISANARIRAAQIAANARMAALNDRDGGGSGGGGASAKSGGGSSKGGLSRIGGHKVTVIDPATGNAYETDDDNEIEARRSLKERDAKRRGLVAYSDPYNPSGEPEYLSPSQARLREAADDEKFKREIERKKPGNRGQLFPNFTDPEFVKAAIEDPALSDDDILQELRSRNFEDREILSVLNAIKKGRKKTRSASTEYGDEEEETEEEIVPLISGGSHISNAS